MNKVSPIIEDYELSADTLQYKIHINTVNEPILDNYMSLKTCKICLEQEEGENTEDDSWANKQNQFIIPCQCKGSVGYVHQKCIKMWIQKQIQTSKIKKAHCEICKSQIFFKKIEINQCDCQMKKCLQIPPSNIICLIGEVTLIGVILVVFYQIDQLSNLTLLKNALISIFAIICAAFILTIILIFRQTFVKVHKQIKKIYSLVESQELGLIEPRQRKSKSIIDRKTVRDRININRQNHRRINQFLSIRPYVISP